MRKVLLGLLLLCVSSFAFAWNSVGHMLVAKIAYDRLQPHVREKVDAMVKDLAKEYPYITQFAQLGPWPDTLKSQHIDCFTHWHYIDIPFSNDGSQPSKNITDDDNAQWAIGQIEPIVQNNKANPFERARFLSFLIHIVGDLHQPLHTVSRVSTTHLDGDQGGNLFPVQWNTQYTNLHHVWDGGMGAFEITASPDNIATLAAEITASYPEQFFGTQINDLKAVKWVEEGGLFAKSFVYNTSEGQVLAGDYLNDGKHIAEQRVALAGYRLAAILNQLLK